MKDYQKIKRLKKECETLSKMNVLRKYQIGRFSDLIKSLIKDGRITKEEANEYIKTREEVEKILFNKQI